MESTYNNMLGLRARTLVGSSARAGNSPDRGGAISAQGGANESISDHSRNLGAAVIPTLLIHGKPRGRQLFRDGRDHGVAERCLLAARAHLALFLSGVLRALFG